MTSVDFSRENFEKRIIQRLLEEKNTLADISNSGNTIKDFYSIIHGKNFIKKVSKITGLTNLKSDETLYAGGLAIMKKNDFINPHIDNSHNSNGEMYK